jgi:hypothetical protein
LHFEQIVQFEIQFKEASVATCGGGLGLSHRIIISRDAYLYSVTR